MRSNDIVYTKLMDYCRRRYAERRYIVYHDMGIYRERITNKINTTQ